MGGKRILKRIFHGRYATGSAAKKASTSVPGGSARMAGSLGAIDMIMLHAWVGGDRK